MSLFDAEPADGGPVKKWLRGYLIPGVIILYAAWAAFHGEIHLPSRAGREDFAGAPARCLAITYLAVAMWQHFHWGWGLSHRLWPHAGKGKGAAWWLGVPSALLFIYLAVTQRNGPSSS